MQLLNVKSSNKWHKSKPSKGRSLSVSNAPFSRVSARPSVRPPARPAARPPVHPAARLRLPVCPSVRVSVCLSPFLLPSFSSSPFSSKFLNITENGRNGDPRGGGSVASNFLIIYKRRRITPPPFPGKSEFRPCQHPPHRKPGRPHRGRRARPPKGSVCGRSRVTTRARVALRDSPELAHETRMRRLEAQPLKSRLP